MVDAIFSHTRGTPTKQVGRRSRTSFGISTIEAANQIALPAQ